MNRNHIGPGLSQAAYWLDSANTHVQPGKSVGPWMIALQCALYADMRSVRLPAYLLQFKQQNKQHS